MGEDTDVAERVPRTGLDYPTTKVGSSLFLEEREMCDQVNGGVTGPMLKESGE